MSTRAFLLAGTHSGCGKSTLAAGLLAAFRLRGRAIAPFKAGPDYLDPMLHAVAAGRASWNLDPFFQDAEGLRESVARGAAGAELALVEGVMGLFDGADPVSFAGSGADLARRLGLPVVLITGYASQLHEAAARRVTVLSKPCPPETLIAAVRAALRRARGLDQAAVAAGEPGR